MKRTRVGVLLTVLILVMLCASPGRAAASLTYFGGEVQNNPRVYLIFWGKNWNQNAGSRDSLREMDEHISGSAWHGILAQYYDGSGPISKTLTVTSWTDESIGAPSSVNDEHLQDEIEYAIAQRGWPGAGVNNQYIVFPAPGSGYAPGYVEGCAQHRWSSRLNAVFEYIGWPNDPEFVDIGGSKCDSDPSGLERAWVNASVSASHEYAESVVNPAGINSGRTIGWTDAADIEEEIGNLCVNQPEAAGVVNGSWVQKIWDNQQNKCWFGLDDTKTTIEAASAFNGNPGWFSIKGKVTGPGSPITGKEVNVTLSKFEGSAWVEKTTLKATVNNNSYEIRDWKGVGPGAWYAKVTFPQQGSLRESWSSGQAGYFEVKDGYRLRARHSGKCLDVKEGNLENGAALHQWECLNPADHQNQVFTVEPQGSGYYRLIARHSGRCVDVVNAGTGNGALLQQWSCNGFAQQSWLINPYATVGETTFNQFIAKHSGKCMDVQGGLTANGTLVQQWGCGAGQQQQWEYQSVNAAPIPTFTTATVPAGEVLPGEYGYATVYGYVKAGAYGFGGKKATIYYKKEGQAAWTTQTTLNNEGRFEVKYMGLGPGNWTVWAEFPGGEGFAASKSGEKSFHVGRGYKLVARHSKKCMSVANNAWGNGVGIVQRECSASSDAGQIFTLVPFEGGKFFEILVNAHSTPQLGACIDVAGGSTANGALLHQWDCSNGSSANQLFQPAQINGEDWYGLMAKHSGKCADVEQASTANGAQIHQWECHWGGNQQWQKQLVG